MNHRLLFHVFESPTRLVLGSLAVLAAAILLVKLLQAERQLVPTAVSRWLLGLRLAVILLLAVALAEPALHLSHTLTRHGRIVVAIDRSTSMTMNDLQATSAEKLMWARGLGLLGNPRIQDRLDRWAADLQAQREPQWVDPGETDDPKRQQQLKEIRRANLDEVLDTVAKLSRQHVVNRLVDRNSRLIQSLQQVGEIEYRVFGGTAETIGDQAVTGPTPSSLDRDRTNLAAALTTGLATGSNTNGSPLIGLVLLSDGRHTESDDPLEAAKRLAGQSIPVYSVPIGSDRLPRDLAIATLDAPRTVFGNDTLRLTATIRTGGFRNRPVAVSMFPVDTPGKTLVQTIIPTGDSHEVTFEWTASQLGRQRLVVRVEPHPDEIRDDNNQKELLVNVVDDVARVLLIDGEARWEFRFIDNALSRDDRADVERVVFDQPFLGLRARPFFPTRIDIPTADDALEQSIFAEADLVIVGDVPPDRMTEPAWTLLEEFVGEAGGTLVMVAGKNHLPRAFRSETLARLLPVSNCGRSMSAATAVAAPRPRGAFA